MHVQIKITLFIHNSCIFRIIQTSSSGIPPVPFNPEKWDSADNSKIFYILRMKLCLGRLFKRPHSDNCDMSMSLEITKLLQQGKNRLDINKINLNIFLVTTKCENITNV